MCGRYYVDDETARKIERLVRNLDRRFRMQASDIRPFPVLRVDTEGRGPGLEEMYWGFPVSGRSGLLINVRAESVLDKKEDLSGQHAPPQMHHPGQGIL